MGKKLYILCIHTNAHIHIYTHEEVKQLISKEVYHVLTRQQGAYCARSTLYVHMYIYMRCAYTHAGEAANLEGSQHIST